LFKPYAINSDPLDDCLRRAEEKSAIIDFDTIAGIARAERMDQTKKDPESERDPRHPFGPRWRIDRAQIASVTQIQCTGERRVAS